MVTAMVLENGEKQPHWEVEMNMQHRTTLSTMICKPMISTNAWNLMMISLECMEPERRRVWSLQNFQM